MSASTNEALVRRAVDAIWNQGDLDVADELFAPGYVNHHGLIPDFVVGPEAMKFSAAMYHVAFPGLTVTIDELISEDDTVALRWTALGGPDPSAETLSTGTTRCRLAGGQVQESWTYWHPMSDRCLRERPASP